MVSRNGKQQFIRDLFMRVPRTEDHHVIAFESRSSVKLCSIGRKEIFAVAYYGHTARPGYVPTSHSSWHRGECTRQNWANAVTALLEACQREVDSEDLTTSSRCRCRIRCTRSTQWNDSSTRAPAHCPLQILKLFETGIEVELQHRDLGGNTALHHAVFL